MFVKALSKEIKMKENSERPVTALLRFSWPVNLLAVLDLLKKLAVPAPSHQSELLDQPDISEGDLAANFRDIKFINRWFGGVALVEKSLRPMLPLLSEAELKLLDLATGVGDVPLALAQRWQKNYRVSITAIDLNPKIAELARQEATRLNVTNFEAQAADIFKYEFNLENGPPYDFVTCSLAFHHFSPAQRVEMLRLMAKLARRGFVVNDLERSWFGYLGAHLLGLTFTRHYLTRHDGPLSVLRAFTPDEFRALVQEANLPPEFKIEVKKGSFSRLAIIGQRIC
jgi:2-polyprenyl-3-methyl-5-hydroxy-6-metoxy-1,4-benzoquinol methylase